jgi:serine/threonine protein kinase
MESKKIDSVRLGRLYLLHDLIGRGGTGAVYLATDRLTGYMVALKHVTTSPADLMFASRGTDPSDLRLVRITTDRLWEIIYNLSRDVLPETKHPIIIMYIQPFNW